MKTFLNLLYYINLTLITASVLAFLITLYVIVWNGANDITEKSLWTIIITFFSNILSIGILDIYKRT